MTFATNLTLLDLLVIGIPFAAIIVVTAFLRRYTRSVADFLAASRCAGRYLISTAIAETGAGVMGVMIGLEVFSRTGFSLRFWESFGGIISFIFGLLGLIAYRYRQTRAMTFHQFFEVRYSKGIRVFASFLNVFSGLFNFGVAPAVQARFFIYFCGIPEQTNFGTFTLPTFIPLMIMLMAISLYFALTGGQISVIVTDCLENLISSVFYIVVAVFILFTVSVAQMKFALLSGAPGQSFVDPFDIGNRTDFNGWYIIFGLLCSIYYYRGTAWNQGFAASAKNPHEGRMASVLGNWRYFNSNAMWVLVSIGAFTLLHHPDFAVQQAVVAHGLENITNPQLQTQMRMPMALGVLLSPGVRGAFCAIVFFGMLAGQGIQLHGYGSTILQDVILPMRKKVLDPKAHVRWLRFAVFGVAMFACVFSMLFKPVDYLVMVIQLIGSIYLGGVGVVVWGGLYWKRGTTAGAWAALSIGGGLGILFNLGQQLWPQIIPWVIPIAGHGGFAAYLTAHAAKCPLNGQQLTLITCLTAGLSYVVVSLLSRSKPFELDAMLHRGKYKIQSEEVVVAQEVKKRNWLVRFLDIDEHFTRGDKILIYGTFGWSLFWQSVSLIILIWSLTVSRLSSGWWFEYTMFSGVWLTMSIGLIVTVWFTIGVIRDMIELFRTLKTVKQVDGDDGTVRSHHNAGEEGLVKPDPKNEKT
jgi:SSS family solute:Na+ symporter